MELNPLRWFRRDASSLERRGYGGVYNPTSGLGGANDKNVGIEWSATSFNSRTLIDKLYIESWFIRDLINVPIDDMFVLWREFEGETAEAMRQAELDFNVKMQLGDALKAGRKYGTGLLLIVSVEDALDTELDPEKVKPGDLRHLTVADRFDVSQVIKDNDFTSQTYGKPLIYQVKINEYEVVDIHASRVLRFDGGPNSKSSAYPKDWGTSVAIPAITASNQDAAIAAAIGHLVQETSSVTLKIQDLNDIVADFGYETSGDSSPSIKERIEQFNRMKSVFNTNVIDAEDSMERTNVNWSSLPRMLEEIYKRMAAISNIPATRLMGQSPVGMNATGESDLVNYAITIAAMQHNILMEPLQTLDMMLAKNAGISEPPVYRFMPLTEVSEESKAQSASLWATTMATALSSYVLDEDEAREILVRTQLFGDLEGGAPERPEPQVEDDVEDDDDDDA